MKVSNLKLLQLLGVTVCTVIFSSAAKKKKKKNCDTIALCLEARFKFTTGSEQSLQMQNQMHVQRPVTNTIRTKSLSCRGTDTGPRQALSNLIAWSFKS